MEKPILPVDIFNDDHLQELIENHEVYGPFIKDIISTLGTLYIQERGRANDNDENVKNWSYSFNKHFDDYIGQFNL